jgi:hypothetical protein
MEPTIQDPLDEIRRHFEALGITEQDLTDAIKWARETEEESPEQTPADSAE